MKTITNIITILLAVILFASCQKQELLIGHWKCDTTGALTTEPGTDSEKTMPIMEFYDVFEMPPLEFEFLGNDTMIWYNQKTTHRESGKKTSKFRNKKSPYVKNYNGDKNKVMILTNDGKDRNLMSIKSITKDVMKVKIEDDDEMYFDIIMKRI